MGGAQQVKTEKPDVDLKTMSPLCTYGRHEDYIMNKLWLNGISSLILEGVGDGMVPWCALQLRIPIMCVYEKELHKKTIEEFLFEKILKKMEEATPKDARWYRTDAQLGCRDGEDNAAGAAAAKAKAAAAAAKAKAAALAKAPAKRPIEDAGKEESSSNEESSSSQKSKKSKKTDGKKNKE
jgi:hypothetical protein